MGRIRVAHVVPTEGIAYLLLRARLQRLQEAGYDVLVICGHDDSGQRLQEAGIPVRYIPFARELSLWTDIRCFAALRRVLRTEQVDIAHSHNPKGTLLGPWAARCAGVPVVVHTVHGFLFNDSMRRPRRWAAMVAERWCALWAQHLLFQSREDYEFARARRLKDPERLHWIGNGIDERRFNAGRAPGVIRRKRSELGLKSGDLVVGMVARLVREKGYEEFFRMAGQLAREYEHIRFLIVGITEPDQSDAVDPRALMRAENVHDRCILLERRDDMPELYACMDIAVLPSHREGIPRALMEACAMGVPVAASDIRGCREVVVHGETGLLFPPRDVPAFAAAVRALVVDEAWRRRLGAAGQRRIQSSFTESRTAERLLACYGRFLQTADHRAPASAGG